MFKSRRKRKANEASPDHLPYVICHFSFAIFRLRRSQKAEGLEMENDKWQMTYGK
jgi:hypothetical protein